MRFELHPTLAADTHSIGDDPTAHLLLHKNATIPWLILVPRTDANEYHALENPMAQEVHARCKTISHFIQEYFRCPKVNFAAIGNLVPQLHIHMVGRKPGDACWPNPVWGHLNQSAAYSNEQIAELRAQLENKWTH